MKREVRNYTIMGMGFCAILILIAWDLLTTINWILIEFNDRTQKINEKFEVDYKKIDIYFFGYGMEDIGFFVDMTLFMAIILIVGMAFMAIYWSVKDGKAKI